MTTIHFSSVPTKYAPKRKMLDFAKPQWHNKLGEIVDDDVMSWLNNIYQDKVFPTREAFNQAYDAAGTEGVCWRNKTMVLNKEDLENFIEEYDGGAFSGVEKLAAKLKALVGSEEKTVFVY